MILKLIFRLLLKYKTAEDVIRKLYSTSISLSKENAQLKIQSDKIDREKIIKLLSDNEKLGLQLNFLKNEQKLQSKLFENRLKSYIEIRDSKIAQLNSTLKKIQQILTNQSIEEYKPPRPELNAFVAAKNILIKLDKQINDQIQKISKELHSISSISSTQKDFVMKVKTFTNYLPIKKKREFLRLFIEIHNRFKILQKEKEIISKLYKELEKKYENDTKKLLTECSLLRESLSTNIIK